jgi:hypothetical protein
VEFERARSLLTASIVTALVAAAGGLLYAKHAAASRRASRAAQELATAAARGDLILRVPHAPGAITLDGDTDDPGWLRLPGPARTGPFVFATGERARPYSSARLVWGGEYLYLALYASDADIETHNVGPDVPLGDDDGFRIVFSRPGVQYAIEVTPKAVISDSIKRGDGDWDYHWNSGAHASNEIDGTVNDPRNHDEEWAIELAIPFDSLGMKGEPGESIGMSLHRCDTPRPGQDPGRLRSLPVCEGWGEGSAGRGRGRIVLE